MVPTRVPVGFHVVKGALATRSLKTGRARRMLGAEGTPSSSKEFFAEKGIGDDKTYG